MAQSNIERGRQRQMPFVVLVVLALFASYAFVQNQRVVVIAESGFVRAAPIEVVEEESQSRGSSKEKESTLLEILRNDVGRRLSTQRTKRWRKRQQHAEVEIDTAILAKRKIIHELQAENQQLRNEQENIIQKRGEGLRGRAKYHQRVDDVSSLNQEHEPIISSPNPVENVVAPENIDSRNGGNKIKYLRLINIVSACTLLVPGDGSPGDDWLRCEKDTNEFDAQTIFQVTPSHTRTGAVRLRTQAGAGTLLEVVPPGEEYAWVVRAQEKENKNDEKERSSFEIMQGVSLRNVKTNGCITIIRSMDSTGRVENVRAHGNRPHQRQAGPCTTPFASFQMQWLSDEIVQQSRINLAQKAKSENDRLKAEHKAIQLANKLWQNSTEKRVIAYGLYGADPKYCTGAIRNSELVHTIFPGWTTRFYVRRDVPKSVINTLRANGAEIVDMGDAKNGNAIAGMFWRFLVADDPTVDRFIVRDSDSRLNPRERAAVEEWIQSKKIVHSIRDHPNHDRPLNGGLWGGTKNCVPNMAKKIHQFSNKNSYGGDLIFLNTVVWPLIKENQISHDAYTCKKYPNSHPFPTRRPPNYQHVGQVFSAADQPRMGDINGFMRGRPIPLQCRKHPEWKFG